MTDEGRAQASAILVPKAAGTPDPEEESGRGLLITEALAARWGTWRTGEGLTVWAELDLPPGTAYAS